MATLIEFVAAQIRTGGLSIAIAAGALALSIASYRRSGPRVRVALSTAIIIDPKAPQWHGRSVVIVNITNDGASPVQVQQVYLDSPAGRVTGAPQPNKDFKLPYSLEARGGQLVWLFDRQTLRDTAGRDAGEEQVQYVAVVESGTTKYKSKDVEVVHPLEPRKVARRDRHFREKLIGKTRDLFSPRPQVEGLTRVDTIDLSSASYGFRVRNFGGGVARKLTVELMRQAENGKMERLGEPIPVAAIWRHRTVTVNVPLQDEEGLFWYLRYKGRARVGAGAITKAAAIELQKGS